MVKRAWASKYHNMLTIPCFGILGIVLGSLEVAMPANVLAVWKLYTLHFGIHAIIWVVWKLHALCFGIPAIILSSLEAQVEVVCRATSTSAPPGRVRCEGLPGPPCRTGILPARKPRGSKYPNMTDLGLKDKISYGCLGLNP